MVTRYIYICIYLLYDNIAKLKYMWCMGGLNATPVIWVLFGVFQKH